MIGEVFISIRSKHIRLLETCINNWNFLLPSVWLLGTKHLARKFAKYLIRRLSTKYSSITTVQHLNKRTDSTDRCFSHKGTCSNREEQISKADRRWTWRSENRNECPNSQHTLPHGSTVQTYFSTILTREKMTLFSVHWCILQCLQPTGWRI